MFTAPFLLVLFNLLVMMAFCAIAIFLAIVAFWTVVIGVPLLVYQAFKWITA